MRCSSRTVWPNIRRGEYICWASAWYLSVLLFSLSSVPSAAPEFNIKSVTATSITITWQPLPPCKQNGVITNYTIAYRMEGGMDMSFSESVVDAANRMHVVEPLTPYTNYTIKMAASTSVGRGEFGPEMTVQANESSEAQIISYTNTLCYGNKQFVRTGVFCVNQIPAGCV